MVIRSRRGASNIGCLVSLALFVAALYYGINIGEVYVKYYQLVQEMRSQARLAPSLTNEVIQRRILNRVDELGLPVAAQRIRITRSPSARSIVIQTQYEETLELPLFHHTFRFKPRAEAPL
jgi:hypothetical protein